MDRWIGKGLVWIVRKLLARAFGNAGSVAAPGAAPGAAPRSASGAAHGPQAPQSAIPLHRDPWCGTYVSPEISFPLEQAGQKLHFCSAECRARYQESSRHAASA